MIKVSSFQHIGGKLNDGQDENTYLLFIYQQHEHGLKMINSALPDLPSIVHATTSHTEAGETPTLAMFLQTQASDGERQTAAGTIGLPYPLLHTTTTFYWIDKLQRMEHYRSTSKLHNTPANYLTHST